LHRTLSCEDSEEIGKGINAILNDRLNAQVARAVAGWATPKADFQLRNSFSFSTLFCKLQINLNLNQI
jgi:hypothetical protein